MKCEICGISVVNYQVHLTDNRNCRDTLDTKIKVQNTEALKQFIEGQYNPKITWTTELTKNGSSVEGRKICTRYIVGKSNKKLIPDVYSEILNRISDYEIKFPDHKFKIEIYSLTNMGFVNYKSKYSDAEPNGEVGLAIRERVIMEKK